MAISRKQFKQQLAGHFKQCFDLGYEQAIRDVLMTLQRILRARGLSGKERQRTETHDEENRTATKQKPE